MLAVSVLIHAELYVHGYRYVPTIGLAFLTQASVFVALAILIAVGGPSWPAMGRRSRRLGLAGGLRVVPGSRDLRRRRARLGSPRPGVLVSVIAEVLTVVLCAAAVLTARGARPV